MYTYLPEAKESRQLLAIASTQFPQRTPQATYVCICEAMMHIKMSSMFSPEPSCHTHESWPTEHACKDMMHISGIHSHQYPSHPRHYRRRSMYATPQRIHEVDTLISIHATRTFSRTQSSPMPPEQPPATPPPAPAHLSSPFHPLPSVRGRCSGAHAPRRYQTSLRPDW